MVTPKCDFHLFGVYSGRIVIFREAWENHEWTPRQSLGIQPIINVTSDSGPVNGFLTARTRQKIWT